MSFKILVVRMMAVVLLVGVMMSSAVPSQAAEKKKKYTNRDVKVLATIIFCEAGNQCYAGKLAVGCVVMNRKRSSQFPNSVEGVIRQRSQFSPVASGKWRAEMRKYSAGKYKKGAKAECVKAAKEALEGATSVKYKGKKINMKRYYFFSQRLSNAKLRIQGHDFK